MRDARDTLRDALVTLFHEADVGLAANRSGRETLTAFVNAASPVWVSTTLASTTLSHITV